MPRLFIASGIFHPDSGGPATYLRQLLPALQERGWEIRVLTYGDAQRPAAEFPYTVRRIPRSATPARQWRYAAAARQEMRRADLVFAHSLDLPLPGRQAPLVLRLGGDSLWERARRRGWLPETMDVARFQEYRGGPIIRALRARRQRQLRHCAAIIAPGEALASMIRGWGAPEERLHVIENAVHARPEILALSREEARAQLGLPPGRILLTVARLQPWKGIGASIRALAELPETILLIAGDGPMRQTWQEQAARAGLSERARFLGTLSGTRLALHYRAADFTVLYSGYEGHSHVLLETLSYGTPALASDIPGNRPLLRDGVNGLLITYETGEAAASARIVAALRVAFSAEMAEQWAGAGLLDTERYTFAHLVERTDALLRAQLK